MRANQFPGEQDGITGEVARDLGFSTRDEVLAMGDASQNKKPAGSPDGDDMPGLRMQKAIARLQGAFRVHLAEEAQAASVDAQLEAAREPDYASHP